MPINNGLPTARKPQKDALPFAHGFAPATANMISKLVFHPCSVPFQVYVETFLPAFIKMVITIVTWDVNDIIRNIGEGIAEPPNRRGAKRKRHIRRIRVPVPVNPSAAVASNALNHVLRWSEPLERIGYLMLLYHATEEFSRDWMGLLYNFEHCGKPPSEGPLQRHADPQNQISSGSPQTFALQHVDQNRALWPTDFFTCGLPFGHFSVTLEVTFRNLALNTAGFKIGFTAPFTLQSDSYWSDEILIGPDDTGSVVLQREIFAPTLVGTQITWLTESWVIPIGTRIEQASVSIFQFQPGR